MDHKAEVTHDYIRRSYHVARKYGNKGKGMSYNEKKVSDIEFRSWILHRERGNDPAGDPAPYIECLAALHSALFGLTLDQVHLSAVKRRGRYRPHRPRDGPPFNRYRDRLAAGRSRAIRGLH